jgi:hypothetical protein
MVCKCGHKDEDHYEGKCHGWSVEGVTNCTCPKWRERCQERQVVTRVLRRPRRLANALKQKSATQGRRLRELVHIGDG